MASFNLSPLSQVSLALEAYSFTEGSNAGAAGTSTLAPSIRTDGSTIGNTFYNPISSVVPLWRRESKVIKSKF